MKSFTEPLPGLRRLVAGFCLLAYLQAGGLVPALLALSAAAEGSHAVSVSSAPEQLVVILHHESAASGALPHRHGVAARVLCLLEAGGPMPTPDHVASFAANSACERTPGELKAQPLQSSSTLDGESLASFLAKSPPSPGVSDLRFSPSALSASLCASRTTVLLI